MPWLTSRAFQSLLFALLFQRTPESSSWCMKKLLLPDFRASFSYSCSWNLKSLPFSTLPQKSSFRNIKLFSGKFKDALHSLDFTMILICNAARITASVWKSAAVLHVGDMALISRIFRLLFTSKLSSRKVMIF